MLKKVNRKDEKILLGFPTEAEELLPQAIAQGASQSPRGPSVFATHHELLQRRDRAIVWLNLRTGNTLLRHLLSNAITL